MEDEYIPFKKKKKIFIDTEIKTLKMLMQKYPKINPIDARRAMRIALNKGSGI